MEKTTLYWIIFLPLFIVVIYIFFFYNKTEKIVEESKKETKSEQNSFIQLEVNNFKKELENWDSILIDIRTPWEWKRYWIIPNTNKYIVFWKANFESEIAKLDKTKKYLLYCFHWNRSETARDYMKSIWFFSVNDLTWWIDAWWKAWEKIEDYK